MKLLQGYLFRLGEVYLEEHAPSPQRFSAGKEVATNAHRRDRLSVLVHRGYTEVAGQSWIAAGQWFSVESDAPRTRCDDP